MSDAVRHLCGLATAVGLAALCRWVWLQTPFALGGTLIEDLGMIFAAVAIALVLTVADKLAELV